MTDDRRQAEHLVDITATGEPILVRAKFVGSIGTQLAGSTQEKLWQARIVVTKGGAAEGLQVYGATLAHRANHSEISLGQRKPVAGAGSRVDPRYAKPGALAGPRHQGAVEFVEPIADRRNTGPSIRGRQHRRTDFQRGGKVPRFVSKADLAESIDREPHVGSAAISAQPVLRDL